MLLVVTYSRSARQALRNACQSHEDAVVQRFGRAALVEATEFGAFLAIRLRTEHGPDVQVELTEPLVAGQDVPEGVRAAAIAYAGRDERSTPYEKFATGRAYPDSEAMKASEL